jgi:hypothetical protein
VGGEERASDGRRRGARAAAADHQPQRVGGVVPAAALRLLRPLAHMDGARRRVDAQHLDQTALAGINSPCSPNYLHRANTPQNRIESKI